MANVKKSSKKLSTRDKLRNKYKYVDGTFILSLLTIFQVFTFIPVIFQGDEIYAEVALIAVSYIFFEWVYFFVGRGFLQKKSFELEFIAFFLSGLGMSITSSVYTGYLLTQFIAVIIGVVVYDGVLFFLKDVKRVMYVRSIVGVFSLIAFAGCYVYIRFFVGATNGAYNWLEIGGFSIQPSEFMKVAFIMVGAASLDKLLTSRSIILYMVYAIGCVGILFIMKDFGTALIFFFTFIVICFMRSGDWKSILFICVCALLGAILVIWMLPTVASRFSSYTHVWDDVYGDGYQQTRTLVYSVSGGLFGLGIGNGQLRDIFASTTDLVFGMVCEEMGILIAFLIVISFAFIAIYAIKSSQSAPSTFYSIAACSASALLLFQICLNIFGITDILPLTGVTLPFISRGGSSMICSWALFAFIKSADIRSYPTLYNQK
ncbi:MAG: FtsW/RodA/SpoVE family cell cycle protein [Clostridia bacterium]